MGVEFHFGKMKSARDPINSNVNVLNATELYLKMVNMVHFMLCVCHT